MDPVEILVDTDERKDESAGTTETAAGGTGKSGGSPTSQRSRTLSVEERTRDLVRDAIETMEKSVFPESRADGQKSPDLTQRDVNGVDHKVNEISVDLTDTEAELRQQKTSSLKRGKKETVVLRPLTLNKKVKDEDRQSLIEPGSPKIVIEREVFTQKTFDDQFEPGRRPTSTIQQRTKKKMSKFSPSGNCCKDFLFTIFPILSTLKGYNIRTDLSGDIIAGLTVGIMHIPQGMAYGMLTTLPPVYGLYMSFFPVLVYFFCGSSKHISIGSFAVACLMIGASVQRGYDKSSGAVAGIVAGADTNTTHSTNMTTTMSYNHTGNASWATTTPGSGGQSGGGSGDETEMPAEELSIRLAYAMSLTFMVGIVQIPDLQHENPVMRKIYTGYYGTSEMEHGLCACTVDNPLAKARGLSLRTGAQTMLYLSLNLILKLVMGITRLGFVTVYLSDPLISGFTTGAACHVFTSQIKHVFGVKTERYSGAFKLIYTYRDFFNNLHQSNAITLMFSIVCMALLYGVSRFINQNPKLKPKMFMPVPIELIVVVLGTLVSFLAKFNEQHEVKVVGTIPTGLPPPTPPFEHLGFVIPDAIALAIVVFAISISMAKLLAKKHDYEVNSNQELVAFGISNCVSAFFASPSPSASMSRSLVQERVGGKTQMAGLVSCALLLVVLLAIGPYFKTLPNCVLAAIIIVALRGMFLQILDLPKLWTVSVIDFMVWVVAFLATVLLDVDLGLMVAVGFGILTIVARSQRPYTCLLGKIPGTDIYTDINVYKEAQEVEGIKIFRFEYSLFFVNTEHFRQSLYKLTLNPRTLKIAQKKHEKRLSNISKRQSQGSLKADARGGYEREVAAPGKRNENEVKINVISRPVPNPPDCHFHTIILDCSSWGFVDTMGVKVLTSTIAEYKAIGVRVFLAKCKAGIREMFEKTRFYESVDRNNVYISVHDAVQHSIFIESPTLEKKQFANESHA